MAKDPIKEARRIAAKPILAEMRWQSKTLPSPLSKLMDYLSKNLFNPDLSAAKAWQGSGIKDHGISVAFRDATGFTLAKYIDRRRLQVSDPMVRTALGIEPAQISWAVGFKYYGTFEAAYREMFGETPEQTRQKAGLPSIDYTAWRCGYFGELDADEAWKHHQTWLQIYPSVKERLRQEYGGADCEPVTDFSGAEIERLMAEGIWQKMQSLPFDEQKRRVRGIRFHSKVFFDLLRKKSREEGRIDRQRGIEVAELALLSLEKCDEIFGEEIHDLRALGWAWLGNAHILAADFSAAEAAFSESNVAWRASRTQTDQRVLARILRLKGALRTVQRRYDEAMELVERSRAIFRLMNDSRGEAKTLILTAAIHGYSNRPSQSVGKLKRAIELIDPAKDRHLAFAAYTNLANSEVRSNRLEAASASLSKARAHCKALNNPSAWAEIYWVDADRFEALGKLSEAKELYRKARAGFLEVKDANAAALLEIDLAIVCTQQGDLKEAAEHSAKALPILATRRFGKEAAAALRLLATDLESGSSRRSALRKAKNALRQDPTARIS